ncbi:uncharacterized protein SCHCODRAFT_02586965 [Schizophyllum commune H4-8]|uniref:uncharacterized protein n=1 Tax=Schizophyllum commune (strain H4-8 / FGSC 9210) TaxID=578458 RepID=UPI0021602750|nr:uncharacterized protein SCHCODRAFT_02586965 [Schizophyllum commune H4-8]KAI5888191.1 hypothetical protein SCHCODRAFT_02586965 [Schizophyllum commune H4-8]
MPPKKRKKAKTTPEAANDSASARGASSKAKGSAEAYSDAEDVSGGDKKQATIGKDAKTPTTQRREQWVAAQENNKTPLTNTRPARNTKLRKKVFDLVGRVSCVVTGLRFHPHFLHVAHIFEALRDDIGISVKKGKHLLKILNLDTSVNQEILCAWLHLLFDGTSVRKNIGQGPIAFVPKKLLEILNNIVNNKGKKNYRELAPDAVYEYELWCFENTNYFLGRYTDAERNYDHLAKEPQVQENVKEDIQLDEEHPVEETGEVGTDHASAVIDPEEVPLDKSFHNGNCDPMILEVGKQKFTFWSPLNPYLATFDLMVKMNYRMKRRDLRRILPPEWRALYDKEMKPKTEHWFPTEAEALAKRKAAAAQQRQPQGRTTENSNRDEDHGASTTGEDPVAPPSPEQADGSAETSASPPSSSPPPDEPSNSSPLGPGLTHFDRAADASVRVQQLDLSAADACRDSSPTAPPSRQASPPVLPEAAFDGDGASAPLPILDRAEDEARNTKSMPERPRQIKGLPKRKGKSNPAPTTSTHPAKNQRQLPSQDDERLPEHTSAREAKAPDKEQEPPDADNDANATPAPVPKAPDKTKPTTSPPSDSNDSLDAPRASLLHQGASTTLSRAPKAPDKARGAKGPIPSMPPPLAGPSSSSAQTTERRQTRAAAKRALEETNAQGADTTEPEPPDRPADAPERSHKKRRVNTRNRPKDPQIERDHDPPESSKDVPHVHVQHRLEEPDIERDHDPPNVNKSRRRGKDR